MRRLLYIALATAACSVPNKQPFAGDAGVDGGLDESGPLETEITKAPAEFSNSADSTFEFRANHASATFSCTLDNSPPAPCTSPFTRNLPDGAHSFSVRAMDAAGMTDSTPAERLWSIDTVAPSTELTEEPPSADNSTMVTFRFTSDEMNVTFQCSLDDAAFAPCRSGDVFGPINDGAHSFAVRAQDRAGNLDASPAIYAWSVDTSTPDTTIIDGPVGATNVQNATFTFLSPDAGPGATFECSMDNSLFLPCTSPKSYAALAMGMHTFQVRVRDAVGNVDPSPATRTWTIDATPPQTTITAAPSDTVAMASAAISFTADENDVTFECNLDGAGFAACTSPFSAMNLSQGAHTFAVRATDIAGNTDPTPAMASWTVDTMAPDIAIGSGPANGDTVGPRVVYMWTASDPTTCSVGGAAAMPCTSPFGFNSAAGAQSFTLTSTDAAGNTTTITRSFTVACAAPDATGALGLLHLDDTGQVLANATGGATATLGSTDQAETIDPTPTTNGRFAGGLSFNAAEGDLVAWPLAGGAPTAYAIELWSQPEALAGTRNVFASGDGRITIKVSGSGSNVVFSTSLVDSSGVTHTVTSAAVAAGAWHHVIASLAEPTLRLWVDGVRTETGDARTSQAAALDSVQLGGAYGGLLDEVWLSSTAITSDETARGRFCPVSGVVY